MRWFIDTGGGDFVSIDSWEWLGFAPDHHFPGGEVTVERLPESNWLITAAASGDPVPMLPQEDRDAVEFQTVHHASDVL
jgi:hypothetical protein